METSRTDEMRNAAAAGDWAAVLRLWEQYAAGIHAQLAEGSCTEACLREARDFLDWAKRVALCERAQAQQRIDALHAVRQYSEEPAGPRSSLRASL